MNNIQQAPIFIINLPEAKNRRAYIKAQLQKHNLTGEIFKASRGDELSESFLDKFRFGEGTFRANLGELGCAFSHYFLLQKIVKEKIPVAMILEDDAYFKEEFVQLMNNFQQVPTGWDLLHVGYTTPYRVGSLFGIHPLSIWHNEKVHIGELKFRIGPFIEKTLGCYGYCVTYQGANKIVKLIESCEVTPIDDFLHDQRSSLRRYGTSIDLVYYTPPSGHKLESQIMHYRKKLAALNPQKKSLREKVREFVFKTLGSEKSPIHRQFHKIRNLRLILMATLRMFRLPIIAKD